MEVVHDHLNLRWQKQRGKESFTLIAIIKFMYLNHFAVVHFVDSIQDFLYHMFKVTDFTNMYM